MRLRFVISSILCASSALAGEYPIAIQTDSRGEYFVVNKGGTANNPTLLVKWVGADGRPYYVKRLFDCKAHTAQYLGEGDTLEQAAKPLPNQEMFLVGQGSIESQLANHVCPKQ